MKNIKCSIITVCYNNKNGLIRTINSVKTQSYKNFEFIIIDGGSKDGSKDIIVENQELLSYWCSEYDGGIYQGMNKGIDKAKGEYCLFLNSGDCFAHQDVLKNIFDENDYNESILYGNIVRIRNNNKILLTYSSKLTFRDFYNDTPAIHHQAAFIKRELFSKYGKYREDTYINADWCFFFMAVVKNNVTTRYINKLISVCDTSGRSQTYNMLDPKVQYDLKIKRTEIEMLIPTLVIEDYKRKNHKFLMKYITLLKWKLSILIPYNLFIRLYK